MAKREKGEKSKKLAVSHFAISPLTLVVPTLFPAPYNRRVVERRQGVA